MSSKTYKPILELIIITVLLYILHKIVFLIVGFSDQAVAFRYSLEQLYGFFFLSSIVLIFVLIKVKQISLDHVGYTFLIITSMKMAISYLFVRPILQDTHPYQNYDKVNFLVVFMLFLTIETAITARLLNNNQ
jgi:hypothetical protein